MKSYPSIPKDFQEIPGAYIFDKLDGSNLRFEWTRKNGFFKYGTRHRLLDETDQVFGGAIQIWQNNWAQPLTDIFRTMRLDKATAFAEFYGPSSFAGNHVAEEPKTLTLFDVCVHPRGFLDPRDFLKFFGHLDIAKFLGTFNWTSGFIEEVYMNKIPGVTFEGVVGKHGGFTKAIRAKAKTSQWIEKIRNTYPQDAEQLINS